MNKTEMINAITHAKEMHLHEMQKIASKISGKEVTNYTALGKMDCECGIWFHSHEKEMKDILGVQFFERLDENHEEWHNSYAKIYKLFEEEEKKSFFGNFFGSPESKSMKKDKEKLYYSELKKDTQTLLASADAAIRRVLALSDKKFY